jgi:hypothetical protein
MEDFDEGSDEDRYEELGPAEAPDDRYQILGPANPPSSHQDNGRYQILGPAEAPFTPITSKIPFGLGKPLEMFGSLMSMPKRATDWATKAVTGHTPAEFLDPQLLANVMGQGPAYQQGMQEATQQHPYLAAAYQGIGERVHGLQTDPAMALMGGPAWIRLGFQALMATGAIDQGRMFVAEVSQNGFTPKAAKLLAEGGVDLGSIAALHYAGKAAGGEAPAATEEQATPAPTLETQFADTMVNQEPLGAQDIINQALKLQGPPTQEAPPAEAQPVVQPPVTPPPPQAPPVAPPPSPVEMQPPPSEAPQEASLASQLQGLMKQPGGKAQVKEFIAQQPPEMQQQLVDALWAESKRPSVPIKLPKKRGEEAVPIEQQGLNQPPQESSITNEAPTEGAAPLESFGRLRQWISEKLGTGNPDDLSEAATIANQRVHNIMEATWDRYKARAAELLNQPELNDITLNYHPGWEGAYTEGMIHFDPEITAGSKTNPRDFAARLRYVLEHEPAHSRGLHTLPEGGRATEGAGPVGVADFGNLRMEVPYNLVPREGIPFHTPEKALERSGWSPEENRHIVGQDILQHDPQIQNILHTMENNIAKQPELFTALKASAEAKRVAAIREAYEKFKQGQPPTQQALPGEEGGAPPPEEPPGGGEPPEEEPLNVPSEKVIQPSAKVPPQFGPADWLNLPRALATSANIHAPLRQSIVWTFRHPIESVKLAGKAVKVFTDAKTANEEMGKLMFGDNWERLKAHPDLAEGMYNPTQRKALLKQFGDPDYLQFKKDGVAFSDIASPEEMFYGSRLIHHLAEAAGVQKFNFVDMSERAFTYYLNAVRNKVHANNLEMLSDLGITRENAPESIKLFAKWANNVTGRGTLGEGTPLEGMLKGANAALNTVWFSPRLIAARIATLNPLTYTRMFKTLKAETGSATTAAKAMAKGPVGDMAGFLAVGSALTAITASALGGKVEDDPRSSDFAKVRIGNVRYSPFGDIQSYVRVAAQLASGETKNQYGKVRNQDQATTLARFAQSKLSPLASIAVTLASHKSYTGERVKSPEEIANFVGKEFLPMSPRDLVEVYHESPSLAIALALPIAFGGSVSAYKGPPTDAYTAEEFHRLSVAPPASAVHNISLPRSPYGNKPSYELTPEESAQVNKELDPMIYGRIQQEVTSEGFKKLPVQQQQLILERFVKAANSMKKIRAHQLVPPPAQYEAWRKGLQEHPQPEENELAPLGESR